MPLMRCTCCACCARSQRRARRARARRGLEQLLLLLLPVAPPHSSPCPHRGCAGGGSASSWLVSCQLRPLLPLLQVATGAGLPCLPIPLSCLRLLLLPPLLSPVLSCCRSRSRGCGGYRGAADRHISHGGGIGAGHVHHTISGLVARLFSCSSNRARNTRIYSW